jgi:hypothetical protein
MRKLLVAAIVALAWAAPAGAQTIQVSQVNGIGCANLQTGMSLTLAGLDGSANAYTIRTLARVGDRTYMNEGVELTSNGAYGWTLYASTSYGTTPGLAAFPLPESSQVRVDLTLERPKGTILSAWTTVISQCNGGAVLYNGSAATLPLRPRTLGLNYERASGRFIGWLTAKDAPQLHSGRLVTIWKHRPGADLKIGQARTTARGNFSLRRERRSGVYYAVAGAIIQPPAGHALKEISLNLRVR